MYLDAAIHWRYPIEQMKDGELFKPKKALAWAPGSIECGTGSQPCRISRDNSFDIGREH
jgi:hypothetical protein